MIFLSLVRIWKLSLKLNNVSNERSRPTNYFLGLEVHRQPQGLFMNQRKYLMDLVQLAGLTNTKTTDTPMRFNTKYRRDEGELLVDPTLHRKLVGCLIYLIVTWPHISYAARTISKFMQTPTHIHLADVHRIIKYLLGMTSRGLFFLLTLYFNFNWVLTVIFGCPNSRKSTTGWCMFLGGGLISWKCKK